MHLSINFRGVSASTAIAALGILGSVLSFSAQAIDLRIVNKMPRWIVGDVEYTTPECKAVSYRIDPGETWSNSQRGSCAIRVIRATVSRNFSGTSDPQAASSFSAPSPTGSTNSDFVIEGTVGGPPRVVASGPAVVQPPAPAPTPVPIRPASPANSTVKWEAVAPGKMPPTDAFKGGRQRFGGRNDAAGNPVYELLPVCRGEINGVTAIGNAAPFYKHDGGWSWNGPTPELRCYVYLNGKEQELAAYEVLMLDPQVAIRNPNAVRWVAGANGSNPAGAFDGAVAGQAAVGCRAQHADGEVWVRVGTMSQGQCYFPYGGQNRLGASYEVLVVESGAGQQLVRGVNEPRLAAEPDRPAPPYQASGNCSNPGGRCPQRADEIRALGAFKINAVARTDTTGRETVRYVKTQGGIWEARSFDSGKTFVRPFAEIERNDNYIILFSGPFDFGGPNEKVTSQTIIFGLKDGYVKAGGSDQLVANGTITWLVSDPKYREGYKLNGTQAYMARAMRAEPETAMSLTMKLANASQATTFWKGASLPPQLIRSQNGDFGNYKVASSGDGWLELYSVVGPRSGDAKWNVHFLKVDFWRNRVWELLGVTDRQPATQDPNALRTLAKSAGPANAWADAYALADASVFSGANIGAALGRLSASQQMGWTLREEVGGSTLRWEELKSDVVARQSGVSEGSPVGRLLTETGRTSRSLTLTGSELGSPLTIDWVNGTITAGGKNVGAFLSGDAEFTGQRKKLPRPTPPGVSPGFQFVNKTDWPVMVKVSQVGCLYHGVVPPQSTMTRNTGAVWFTLSASWSGDGKDLTKEQVFTDCVAPVALTTLGVIAAAATGGSAVGVVALGASSAATAGAATTAVTFLNASGASQGSQDAVAAGIFVVAAAASGGVGAFQVVSTRMAPGMTAAMARSAMTNAVSKGVAKEALVTMRDEAITAAAFTAANSYSEPSDADMGVLQSWFDKEISLAGQYAGYPWPWKMKDRVMPQYEITGGPRVDTLKDGSKLIRKGSPFKFTRVN